MNKLIANILVPIQLNEEYILVLKQAAELAREHNSIIHLLYVESVSYNFRTSWLPKVLNPGTLFTRLKEKSDLMNTWKRWLEQEYGLQATCTADWGNQEKMLLKYAAQFHADLIILKEQQFKKHWFSSMKAFPTESMINKSNCQVIMFFSKKNTIAEWKQVVIPVTGFIPLARIHTIVKSAKIFNIKIHLIALSGNRSLKSNSGFHFLTESLKFLKHYHNIQVECKYVKNSFNPLREYIKYAKRVGADALMTNTRNQVGAGKIFSQNSNAFPEALWPKSNPILSVTS